MATSTKKKVVVKKTLQQQIEETKAKLSLLEEKRAAHGLETDSPGMDKLLEALQSVADLNKCKFVEIFRSVSRIKRLGLKFEVPKKTRKTTSKSTASKT